MDRVVPCNELAPICWTVASECRQNELMRPAIAMLGFFATGCELVFTLPEPADAASGDDAEPVVVKHIFVSSEFFTGDLGGLAGADEKCARLASSAGLTGTYLAWLSTSAASPATRMTQHPGPYHAIGDAPIANSWTELTSGMLLNALRTDERGEAAPMQFICRGDEAWSNTRFDGTFEIDSCDAWTSNAVNGTVGSTFYKDRRWTYDPDCPLVGCNNGTPIFCVEQ